MRQPATQAGLTDAVIDQSVFEGMFLRALDVKKIGGGFLEDLIAVGYDPRNPQPKYPAHIFKEALKVACRHVHPSLPEDKALYELGRRFIGGFFETIVGRLIGAMLPFLSTETVVKRLPKLSAMTSTHNRLETAQVGPGVWHVTWHNLFAIPEFSHGLMTAGLERGKLGTVALISKNAGGFTLEFRAPKS